jgi:hypothetical protein
MMAILSEQQKRMVTELIRLEERSFVQGVCYFITKIPKFIKKGVNVQNINSILFKS